jgi:hypothetical protein
VIRYLLPFLGGFLAIFAHIYLYAGRGNWFAPQRLAPALGNALIFAHIFALMIYLAHEKRLAWPLRIILCLILGIIAWWAHLFFYLYQTTPDFPTLVLGGFGLSFGFILAGLNLLPLRSGRGALLLPSPFGEGSGVRFHARNWGKFLIAGFTTFIFIYLPIYWSYQNFLATITRQPAQALLYFQADNPEHLYLIGIPFSLCLAFFGSLSLLFAQASETKTPLSKEE